MTKSDDKHFAASLLPITKIGRTRVKCDEAPPKARRLQQIHERRPPP